MRTRGLGTDANAWTEGAADGAQGFAGPRTAAPGTTPWSQLKSLALSGLVMVMAGCSGGATLESVLKPDGGDATVEDIRVFRNGAPLTPALSMELVSGDEIQTEADSTAIIRFANGTEVFVGPNTHIRIGSLWVLFGEIYVKARGLFRVETLYVTAGVEGTEYLLTVGSEAEMSMVVLDGAVRLTSKTGGWEPVALRKLEQGVFLPQQTPLMSRVDPVEGHRIMQAINQPVPQILVPASVAATRGLPSEATGVVTTPPAAGTGVVITPRPPGTGSGVVSQPRSPETGVGARPPRPPEIGVPKAQSQPQPAAVPKAQSQSPAVIKGAPILKAPTSPKLPTVPPGPYQVGPKSKLQMGPSSGVLSQPTAVTPPAVPKLQPAPPAGFRQRLLQQPPPSPR